MTGRKTAGKIFGEAINYYMADFSLFFVTTLIVYGFSFLWAMLSGHFISLLGLDNASLQRPFSTENLQMHASAGSLSAWLPVACTSFLLLSFLSMVLSILLSLPSAMFTINASDAMLYIHRGERPTVRIVAQKFCRNWLRYLGVSAWSALWVLLWTFVFIIPGIVKTYSYLLAPYLILEYPDMTVRQALRKSIDMTTGFKGRLFGMGILAALPVFILILLALIVFGSAAIPWFSRPAGILTPFISLFWLMPVTYMMQTIAYLDIKQLRIDYGLLPPSVYGEPKDGPSSVWIQN